MGQSKRLYITSCFWVHRRSLSCQERRETQGQPQNEPGSQREVGYHCFSSTCPQVTTLQQDGHGHMPCPTPHHQRMCPSEEGSQDFPPALYLLPNISPEPPSSRGRPFSPHPHKHHGGLLRGRLSAESLASSSAAWLAAALYLSASAGGEKNGRVHSKDLTPL